MHVNTKKLTWQDNAHLIPRDEFREHIDVDGTNGSDEGNAGDDDAVEAEEPSEQTFNHLIPQCIINLHLFILVFKYFFKSIS